MFLQPSNQQVLENLVQYCKLLIKKIKSKNTHLSGETSLLTAALSSATPTRLFHLHFLLILQLQGLHLLNNTGATADS